MITRLQTWFLYNVPLIAVTYGYDGKMIGSFPYDVADNDMAFNDVLDYCDQFNDLGIDCHTVNQMVRPFGDDSPVHYEDMSDNSKAIYDKFCHEHNLSQE